MNTTNALSVKDFINVGMSIPLVVILMLAMMILPLPAMLLDLFFTFNISLSLLILLSGVYISRPLDFSVFPTILLLTTLLRLALNVASTRVVLLTGHTGTDAAGQVIQSFGEVVAGGNYAVGLVVFSILVIINFVVVTKGAGRISEVTARFTLDSMPGKQMAIDADLNAGIINQEEAKLRREEVSQESDFYGAMDGASKFVRGDAVAGILILFINLLGGVAIGTIQHGLTFSDAMRVYALLTIGDGLVAQIPALLLSIAAAIMVTRVSKSQDMARQVQTQMFTQPKAIGISGGILALLGVIPGMPHFAFLSLGLALAWYGFLMHQRMHQTSMLRAVESEVIDNPVQAQSQAEPKDLDWEDVPVLDAISLEVGYRLIPLVDKAQDGILMNRIKGVRKKLSEELGFLIPTVHIKDNVGLTPNAYRISLMGVIVGESEIYLDKDLAINPGQVLGSIEGLDTKDPAFGLSAKWIDKGKRDRAQTLGFTVVDAPTVIATHLSQLIQTHAHELFGHDEAQKMLDQLGKTSPKLSEDLVPGSISMVALVKVPQNLLLEHVPVRDSRTIAQTLSAIGSKSQDPAVLTEGVRAGLSRLIVQQIYGSAQDLSVMTLDTKLEQILQQAVQTMGNDGLGLEPSLAEKLQKSIADFAKKQEIKGEPSVLLVPNTIRRFLSKFVRYGGMEVSVLAYSEIPEGKQIKVVASVGQ